jgi:hypothetical protein
MNKTLKLAAILSAAFLVAGTGAKADLITNGSFEGMTGTIGQVNWHNTVTGWGNNNGPSGGLGYNFIFSSGSADTTGADGQSGNLKLWGPGDGSANGLPASSPDGGNYIAADGAFQTGAITQTINGLVVGQQYQVGFWWAGAQQQGYNGDTTEQWLVSLGAQQLATAVIADTSHGFTGWVHTYLTFTATNTSEVLSFLAAGTPNGVPPFSLLDGVTMNQVPEPASMTLFGSGLAALAFVRRRKRR